jgi:RNA polymerase sigma-70 factor (ECF subfamily)
MFQCDCPPDDCAGRVRLYLAGERQAGDELARKFAPLVHSIVQRVLGAGRREHWEDACQAIFLRLFTNLAKWGQRCPFCKWLAVVAARRAIDLGRLTETPPADPLLVEDLADPRPPPDRETIEQIERAVARFPAEWRQVWDWYVQGLPREEMARRCGKSLRTVQYWLAEMLDHLREGLGECDR